MRNEHVQFAKVSGASLKSRVQGLGFREVYYHYLGFGGAHFEGRIGFGLSLACAFPMVLRCYSEGAVPRP